jgi:acetyl esterase/lipase
MTTSARSHVGALLILFAATPSCRADDPKYATEYDLVYSTVGESELKLDLARPAEGSGPFPAVLVIHGGAWREGKKEGNRPLLSEFAKRGYVAISPQYRFCPKDTFPSQVHDVKAAVRWLRSNAEKYKVDVDHIGAMGYSAGGHLSLMLGLTSPADGLEGDVAANAPSSRVQAVVNFFGPTDMAADDLPEVSKSLIKDFLGGTPAEKPDAAAKASPLTFVTKDDPPVLTFQGTKDPLIPHSQAIKLGEAMTRAGVGGRVELLIGAGHGWGDKEIERTIIETATFFDKYLKPNSAAPKAQ